MAMPNATLLIQMNAGKRKGCANGSGLSAGNVPRAGEQRAIRSRDERWKTEGVANACIRPDQINNLAAVIVHLPALRNKGVATELSTGQYVRGLQESRVCRQVKYGTAHPAPLWQMVAVETTPGSSVSA
ncbi:hypothetical protein [Advenella kashmirensis]|nr:hypothetical protein [Advenella kashmirensis]